MRRAIRGGDEIRAIMIATLLQAIKDYLHGSHLLSTEKYLFLDDKDSTDYVFGLEFICTYLGYDPDVMREKVRRLKEARQRVSGRRLVSL